MINLILENKLIFGLVVGCGFLIYVYICFRWITSHDQTKRDRLWQRLRLNRELLKSISQMAKNQHILYILVAEATVRLRDRSHGVLVQYRDKIVFLTAAHCLQDETGEVCGGLIKLSSYYIDQKQSAGEIKPSGYESYGFLDMQNHDPTYAFKAEEVKINEQNDLACVSNFISADQLFRYRRPLEIADYNPESNQLVFGLHAQKKEWNLLDNQQKLTGFDGESLFPALMISCGRSTTELGFYTIAAPAFLGYSGMPVVDHYGKLLGIVAKTSLNKRREVKMFVVPALTISEFLEKVISETDCAEPEEVK